jgi:hypothetical protein
MTPLYERAAKTVIFSKRGRIVRLRGRQFGKPDYPGIEEKNRKIIDGKT